MSGAGAAAEEIMGYTMGYTNNSTADHGSTQQAAYAAIDESKRTNTIVHVRGGASLVAELVSESDGYVANDGVAEVWGADIDGNTWRVHVEVQS